MNNKNINKGKIIIYVRSEWAGKCIQSDKIIKSILTKKPYSEDISLIIVDFDNYKEKLLQLGIKTNPSIAFLKDGKVLHINNDIFGYYQIKSLIKDIF